MKDLIQLLFLSLLFNISGVKGAKILAVFHVPVYSHYSLGLKLMKPLAEKGHHVTMLSPFKLDKPPKTWKDIVVKVELDRVIDRKEIFLVADKPGHQKLLFTNSLGYMITSVFLENLERQKFLQSNETYDLIIIEKFYNEALLGLSHHFKAPYIILSTIGSSRWINPLTGNPGSPAYVPDLFLDYTYRMSFWQRLHNTFIYIFAETVRYYYIFQKNQRLLEQYFPDSPKLEDLYYNASLVLINSHLSIKPAVPSVPNMINVGGYHVGPLKRLPEDLQLFLDNAKEGVIYFSLGSGLQSKYLPEKTRNEIVRVLSGLKQSILWKWENDTLPNQPANVKLGKWFPQQDILAHPNVVLFITHCGLLSTIEAIYHGVPLLGIPVFAEQMMNAAEAESNGYAVSVPFKDFTEEKFRSALKEVLNNPRYRENVQTRSKILHDQPATPLETALFWIEYVIRHKGAPHLRSVTLDLQWYQYLLLDILLFVVIILMVAIALMVLCIKTIKGKKSVVDASKKRN